MENKYFACDCGGEVLNIAYDKEDGTVYLAMYHYGAQDHRLSWKEIIRWTWHMIRKRKLFNDELVFDKEKVQEIGRYLLEVGNETSVKEQKCFKNIYRDNTVQLYCPKEDGGTVSFMADSDKGCCDVCGVEFTIKIALFSGMIYEREVR